MLRSVTLPVNVAGHLYLHSLPGRYEPLAETQSEIVRQGISCVVCLAPLEEIRQKSHAYAEAIEQCRLPWQHVSFPINDYAAPEDERAFSKLAQDIGNRLQNGERILIHCGAGIGRTGTLATCVLIALGIEPSQARALVARAGAGPERESQRDIVEKVIDAMRRVNHHDERG